MRLAAIQLLMTLGVQALTIGRPNHDIIARGVGDSIKFNELEYNPADKIGQGADGDVFKAKKNGRGTTFAFKDFENSGNPDALKNEIDSYKDLDGSDMAPKFEAVVKRNEGDENRGILMELIEQEKLDMSSEKHAGRAAQALKVMHDKDRLHGDIRPANILVSKPHFWSSTKVLLIDFGKSKKTDDDDEKKEELKSLQRLFAVKWKEDEYEVDD